MSTAPGPDPYSDADRARLLPEEPSGSGRGAFARDRARVLHSGAFRRLAGKTQVVEPGGAGTDWPGAVPRTRLTHSLECAQIGRELGAALGCDADLVDAACLAHDLGHPPFGHNGERALDEAAQACGGFEGNAQSLRVLTRLEVKHEGVGLNLTRAALDAATKYPWPRDTRVKYGAYDDDLPVFRWLREGVPPVASDGPEAATSGPSDAGGERRCLEAQVMDWADDVAYSVHDLEDGIAAGLVPVDRLRDPAERDELCAVAEALYLDEPAEALREVFDELLAGTEWPSSFVGTAGEQAALKATTSRLIGRFCTAALQATREAHGPGPLRRYGADLVVPRRTRAECGLLKAAAARYVMDRPGVHEVQARERELLTELVEVLADGAPGALEPARAADWAAAADDASRLRTVVDQVASLTDAAAAALHARLLRDGAPRPARTAADGPTLPRTGTSPSSPPGSQG